MLTGNPVVYCVLFFEKRIHMDAIIYTTNTGSTERYAKRLAQEIGLPTYSLTEAKKVRGNIYETLFWKYNYNRYNGDDPCVA